MLDLLWCLTSWSGVKAYFLSGLTLAGERPSSSKAYTTRAPSTQTGF